ncbi:MAG: phospholipid-binding lipoprotein MlaA [Phenylobacterium sp.]|jgi:phospholipid-binding lipoprotein MlaA
MKSLASAALVALLLLTGGCSSTSEEQTAAQSNEADYADERDPLEDINRSLWDFNWKVLDQHILRPAAVGYHEYVPDPIKTGLINVVNNLDEPFTLINELLQFKLMDAGLTTGRFLLNSTVGIFGIFDVASHVGLKRTNEDFGQTLGVWGVDNGAYLMLPGMGPSTVKDTTGLVVDSLAFSFNLLSFPESLLKLTIKTLDTRYQLISQEQLLNDSLDPYEFTKEAYLQRQEYKKYDGEVPEEEFDMEDEDEDEEDLE